MKHYHYILALCAMVIAACNNDISDTWRVPIKGDTTYVESKMGNKTLDPKTYCDFINHSQTTNTSVVQDSLEYTAVYKTPAFMVCNLLRKNSVTHKQYDSLITQYDHFEFADIKIQLQNGDGDLLSFRDTAKTNHDKRVKYYAFEAQKDIYLVNGNDTVPCAFSHFEQSYNILPYITLVCAFERRPGNHTDANRTVLFYDKIFKKNISMKFRNDFLKNIPKLKTI